MTHVQGRQMDRRGGKQTAVHVATSAEHDPDDIRRRMLRLSKLITIHTFL